jgi:hypothetical protein
MTSAMMKPFSKSEWILPAACGALVPRWIVHARTSSSPDVKKYCNCSVLKPVVIILGRMLAAVRAGRDAQTEEWMLTWRIKAATHNSRTSCHLVTPPISSQNFLRESSSCRSAYCAVSQVDGQSNEDCPLVNRNDSKMHANSKRTLSSKEALKGMMTVLASYWSTHSLILISLARQHRPKIV